MDFDLDDIFVANNGNLSPMILILVVLIVVVGAVAVFIFGFKEAEPPRLRKFSNSGSKGNKQVKLRRAKMALATSLKETKISVQLKSLKKEESVPSKTIPTKHESVSCAVPTKNTTKAVCRKSKNDSKKCQKASVTAKKVSNVKDKLPSNNRTGKPVDNDLVEGGDWQTVTSKKHKKSSELLHRSSVAVDTAINVSEENVKSPKKKQSGDKASKVKKATFAAEQNVQKDLEPGFPADTVKVVEKQITTVPVTVASEAELLVNMLELSNKTLGTSTSNKQAVLKADNKPAEEILLNGPDIHHVITEGSGWTEKVVRNKTKKRALKE